MEVSGSSDLLPFICLIKQLYSAVSLQRFPNFSNEFMFERFFFYISLDYETFQT